MISYFFSRAKHRAIQKVKTPRAGSWVVAIEPTEKELDKLAERYGLDCDNLTDAVDLYEAPRVEVEGEVVYIYTRYCYPESAEVATEPLLIVHTPEYLLTVMRKKTATLDRMFDDRVDVVTTQKTKTMLQIFGEINRSYELHLNKVAKSVLQLRAHMRQSQISNREFVNIIEIEEDLNEFQSALQPQALLFSALTSGKYLRLYEEDRGIIEDIERSTSELIQQVRAKANTLVNMRQAYDAIATNNLNMIFKRLTSIAIFLTIPTIIGGFWGMNVAIPYQHTHYAFLEVIVVISLLEFGTIWYFRKRRWF